MNSVFNAGGRKAIQSNGEIGNHDGLEARGFHQEDRPRIRPKQEQTAAYRTQHMEAAPPGGL